MNDWYIQTLNTFKEFYIRVHLCGNPALLFPRIKPWSSLQVNVVKNDIFKIKMNNDSQRYGATKHKGSAIG